MKCYHPYWISCVLATLVAAGCGSSSDSGKKAFDVLLLAQSDDGRPLEGVAFRSGKTLLGISNDLGRQSVAIHGHDGELVPIAITCPDGFVSLDELPGFRLTQVRRVNQTDPSVSRIEVTCTKKTREIVLVVHTSDAPSLPVDVGGKAIGQTDAYGNAHHRVQLDRDVRQLSVSLGTTAEPTLRPQNPSRVFELDGKDAILVFSQTFAVERKRPATRGGSNSPVTPKRVPYRIGAVRDFTH